MGDKEWFQVCGPQVQSRAFHCTLIPNSRAPPPPSHCEGWKHTSASGGVYKVPWAVVGLAHLIQEAHQCAEDTVQGCSQPHPSGCSFEVGRSRHTSDAIPGHWVPQAGLWLHCVWLSIKHWSTTTGHHLYFGIETGIGSILHQPSVQPVHRGQRSSVGGTSVKAVHALYYLKTHTCINNPAHHALHEFNQTTRDSYAPKPNGKGGMTRPQAAPIGFKVEEAMGTSNFPPGTHNYDPRRQHHWRSKQTHDLQTRSPG